MPHPVLLKNIFMVLLVLAAYMVISGCTSPEGNAANGKKWYSMHTCYACHGIDGKGRRGGPNIAGIDMGYRSFLKRLRNSQTAIMPQYSEEKINDQDAADILAYLKSLN
jgi:cytochrome c553